MTIRFMHLIVSLMLSTLAWCDISKSVTRLSLTALSITGIVSFVQCTQLLYTAASSDDLVSETSKELILGSIQRTDLLLLMKNVNWNIPSHAIAAIDILSLYPMHSEYKDIFLAIISANNSHDVSYEALNEMNTLCLHRTKAFVSIYNYNRHSAPEIKVAALEHIIKYPAFGFTFQNSVEWQMSQVQNTILLSRLVDLACENKFNSPSIIHLCGTFLHSDYSRSETLQFSALELITQIGKKAVVLKDKVCIVSKSKSIRLRKAAERALISISTE